MVRAFGPNPIPFHLGNTVKPLLTNSTTGVEKLDKNPGVQFNCGCKLEFKQGYASAKVSDKLCADCEALCGSPGYVSPVVGVV
jgi:hypothetical protein